MANVSAIVVNWNGRKFLEACLKSLRENGDPVLKEVIVVDNASTDGSCEMVATGFPEVTLIRNSQNLGFARGNNLGIKKASCDYLALVNSDVVVHPDCLKRLVEFLSTNPEVGLVGPKVLRPDGSTQRNCRKLPSVWNGICRALALDRLGSWFSFLSGREIPGWNGDKCEEVEVIVGIFWLVRRNALEKIGGLDEQFFFYGEDVDWCKRFHEGGWKRVFLPDAVITHRGAASSAHAPIRYYLQQLKSDLLYWRKHYGRCGLVFMYILSMAAHLLRLFIRWANSLARRNGFPDSIQLVKRELACMRWLLLKREVL